MCRRKYILKGSWGSRLTISFKHLRKKSPLYCLASFCKSETVLKFWGKKKENNEMPFYSYQSNKVNTTSPHLWKGGKWTHGAGGNVNLSIHSRLDLVINQTAIYLAKFIMKTIMEVRRGCAAAWATWMCSSRMFTTPIMEEEQEGCQRPLMRD